MTAINHTVEISTKGKWSEVPALLVGGTTIILKGRWIKQAVIHNEQWVHSDVRHPELYVNGLKTQTVLGVRADIFTFAQKLPDTLPQHKYLMEWESVAAIHVTSFDAWWEGLPQETRKNVRRSTKRGVAVKIKELDADLIRGIVEVNNDAPFRQRIPNVHYGKTVDQVRKDQVPFLNHSDFICAYVGDELVGFVKLVYAGQTASILQFHLKPSHQDKKASNALLAKAVEVCVLKKVPYLIYGLFDYGNKSDSSLREFKVRNGFREMCVPRFYVPLTLWGRFCLRIGLHRGLLGILPSNVIKVLVNARAKWYGVRQLISRCSLIVERPNSNRQTECANPPAGSNTCPHNGPAAS